MKPTGTSSCSPDPIRGGARHQLRPPCVEIASGIVVSRHPLDPLLSPGSIAFVGASARPDTPGHDMMRMIRAGGFKGVVHAVNPNHTEIEGFPCVPELRRLPSPPDLAVLSVKN